MKLARGKNKSSELLTSLNTCLKMAILQLADAYEELSEVYKTYIGRKIELVFNLFDSIFFDSSFRIQGCKCEQLMRYLNFQHQFLRCLGEIPVLASEIRLSEIRLGEIPVLASEISPRRASGRVYI